MGGLRSSCVALAVIVAALVGLRLGGWGVADLPGSRTELTVLELARLHALAMQEGGATIELTVREWSTRAPVRDAVVRWTSHDEWEALKSILGSDLDTEHGLERLDHTAVTDPRGRARLPRPDRAGFLQVRAGSLQTSLQIDPQLRDSVDVLVDEYTNLAIRVRDARGLPVVDGPVRIDVEARLWGQRLRNGGMRRWTDAQHGEVRDAEIHVEPGWRTTPRIELSWSACFDWPIPELSPVSFDGLALPVAPIEIVLPPTGGLRVRCVDGRAAARLVAGALRILPAGTMADTTSFWARAGREPCDREWFHHVGLGQRFDVEIEDSFGTRRVIARGIEGPRELGETIDIVVTLPDDLLELRWRLRDPRGRLIGRVEDRVEMIGLRRDASWMIGLRRDASWRIANRGQPDAQGYCHAWLVAENAPESFEALEFFCDGRGPDGKTPTQLGARAPILCPPRDGIVDLGDVWLHPRPLAVAGRVRDYEGRPIAGVQVALQAFDSERDNPRTSSGRSMPWGSVVRTAADGTFELRGFPRAGWLWVVASWRNHPVLFARCEYGARGVELVERRARVAGHFLLPSGVSASGLQATLAVQSGADGAPRYAHVSDIDGEGRFCFEGVDEGVAHIALRQAPGSASIVRVEGIEIPLPERGTELADLVLDVRDQVRPVTIALRDERGEPVRDGLVLLARAEPGRSLLQFEAHSAWSGHASVLVSSELCELWAWAPGRMLASAVDTEGSEIAIELPVVPEVELVLDRETQIPVSPSTLWVELVLLSRTAFPTAGAVSIGGPQPVYWRLPDMNQRTSFDERRRANLSIPARGAYEMRFWIDRAAESDSGTGRVHSTFVSSQVLNLASGDIPASIVVRPDPAPYARSIR